jgi:hypothetical protein
VKLKTTRNLYSGIDQWLLVSNFSTIKVRDIFSQQINSKEKEGKIIVN